MKAPPLTVTILIGMGAGLLVGLIAGPAATPLGELGKLVIQLIKAVATPLLFLAIVNAILETRIEARSGLRMLLLASFNASIALAIGLAVSNLGQPGTILAGLHGSDDPAATAAWQGKQVSPLQTIASYIPSNIVSPFAENLVISVVLLALLLGFGLRKVREEQVSRGESAYLVVEHTLRTLNRMVEVVLGWIIKLIPLAVFGVVARTVGEYGLAPLGGLLAYVAAGLVGLTLHVLITYQLWVRLWAKIPLRTFWREAKEPVITALGTNSSLATLPVTLRALDRLGVRRSSSALGACVGTNFNNDGIILYEGMAVLFVAQASGIELTLAQQMLAAGTCLVAAMGVAGVPEAGFVSLALVLNTVGMPLELLPLLLTVDWVIARARSVVNVLSDMVLSIGIDRGAGVEAVEG